MEEDLRAHLTVAAPLTNLVADRIQWDVRDAVSPSLALYLISDDPDRVLKGPSGLVQARVQCDCWGLSWVSAKAVGDALKASLPAIGQVVGGTKFLNCAVIDTERGRFGDSPNILHRTRHDVRVSYKPA